MGKHVEQKRTIVRPRTINLVSLKKPQPFAEPAPEVKKRRWIHRTGKPMSLVALSFVAVVSFLLVNVVDPYSGAVASPYYMPPSSFAEDAQGLNVSSGYTTTASRDNFTINKPVVKPATSGVAPVAGTPDPDTAQAIGYQKVLERGWGTDQYDCLVSLWNKESRWNTYAQNRSSGAYGIPQALPGEKMATVAPDWQTNPATQIEWGLRYIQGRYGSPCGAWAHSQARNWY